MYLLTDDFTQLTLLILISKDRALKAKKERMHKKLEWEILLPNLAYIVIYCKKFDSIGLDTNLIIDFIEVVLKYKDNTKYFNS